MEREGGVVHLALVESVEEPGHSVIRVLHYDPVGRVDGVPRGDVGLGQLLEQLL